MYNIGTDKRFEICLPFTLKEEGGYSNDPHDSGGKTMEGIIQREYDAYRRRNNLPLQWVKNISDAELHDIYYNEYWLPHCPQLFAGLDLSFFDQCVNEGPREAIILLQRVLNLNPDGIWGDQTAKAISNITPFNYRPTIEHYSDARARFYKGLSKFKYFGKDWLFRTATIETQSLAMLKGN